ncbi:MAG: RNA polymerase subunit sigma [Opitutaceae bacterium]|nr:RNA polymerase subunit sigma [Opitutaceae bacterium]
MRPVHDITLMLLAAGKGDPGAADRLMLAVYGELRTLAAAKVAGERNNVTLQPTALVHEAWLRLGGDQPSAWQNRAHFFAAAAEAMRRILIDRARKRGRQRRGGGLRPLALDVIDEPAAEREDEHLLAVDEALGRLAAEDANRAELVKLRFFVGLTLLESAAVLGISESTAKRWWAFSRAWLLRELRGR